MLDEEWMSEAEAAAEVDKAVRTLRKWRHKRIGPPYAFFGKTVKYHRSWATPAFVRNEIGPVAAVVAGNRALCSPAHRRRERHEHPNR